MSALTHGLISTLVLSALVAFMYLVIWPHAYVGLEKLDAHHRSQVPAHQKAVLHQGDIGR